MDFSFAKEADKEAIRTIWQYCFQDTDKYLDSYFSHVYKTENSIVARDGDAIIASLQMIPHSISMHNKEYRGMYIGGVSVLPSHRGKGIASSLMQFAEKQMRENQIDISFLIPFRFEFYKKLGYTCISYLSEISGEIAELRPFIVTDGVLSPLSCPPLKAYSKFINKFPLHLKRSMHSYTDEIFKLCSDAYCYALHNDAGYILYTLQNSEFNVLECVYNDEISLRRLLGFIYTHRSELKTFRVRTSANGEMRKILCENVFEEKRYPHAMGKNFGAPAFPDCMENYINMLGWF